MAIAEQFELLELIHRDVVETWLAVEKGSKRRLLLHYFKEDTGLRDRLISMAPNDLIMLVSAEKEGDAYIVVTHDIPALRQFREWIERRSDPVAVKEPAKRPEAVSVKAAAVAFDPDKTQIMPQQAREGSISGEFARMFEAPTAARVGPLGDPPALGSLRDEPSADAGEFTRMFRPAAAGPVNPPVVLQNEPTAVPASVPVLPNEPNAEPGEFTRMFRPSATGPGNPPVVLQNEPPPVPASAPVLPNEPSVQSSEFTHMFRPAADAPVDSSAVLQNEPTPVPASAPVLPNEPSGQSSDFTRMFQPASAPVNPPAVLRYEPNPVPANTPTPRNEPGAQPSEFSRMFQSPTAAPANPPAVLRNEPNPVPAGMPAIRNEPSAQPSEFTRMFQPSSAAPADPSGPLRKEPNPVPASAPVSRREPAAQTSDFTRMFEAPATTPVKPSVPLRNEPAARPPASGVSEFTRIFSGSLPATPLAEKLDGAHPVAPHQISPHQISPPPVSPPPVSPPPAQPRTSTDFTRMFGQPQNLSTSGMPAAPYGVTEGVNNPGATGIFVTPKSSQSSSMPPSAPAGPGEYTRMFQSAGAGPASAEAPVQTQKVEKKPEGQQKTESATKLWPLVIVLAVLVIAGVALLVYFLAKK